MTPGGAVVRTMTLPPMLEWFIFIIASEGDPPPIGGTGLEVRGRNPSPPMPVPLFPVAGFGVPLAPAWSGLPGTTLVVDALPMDGHADRVSDDCGWREPWMHLEAWPSNTLEFGLRAPD